MVALGGAIILAGLGLKLGHLMAKRFYLLFHFEQGLKDGKALLKDCAPGERKTVLGKIPRGDGLAG